MPHRRPCRQPLALWMILAPLLAISACSNGGEQGDGDPSPSVAASSPASSGTTALEEQTTAGSPRRITGAADFLRDARRSSGAGRSTGDAGGRTALLGLRDELAAPGDESWPVRLGSARHRSRYSRGGRCSSLAGAGSDPGLPRLQARAGGGVRPGAASMPDLAAWRRYVTAVAQRYGTASTTRCGTRPTSSATGRGRPGRWPSSR